MPVTIDVDAVARDIALDTKAQAWREIELLAITAASPIRAFAILSECELQVSDFTQLDTRAIYAALLAAAGCPDPSARHERAALLARAALREQGRWDDGNCRTFINAGSRWGPGPLAVLFTRGTFSESAVLHAAAAVLHGKKEYHYEQ